MMYLMDRETVALIKQADREFPCGDWSFHPDCWDSEEAFREDLKHRLNELRKKQAEKK